MVEDIHYADSFSWPDNHRIAVALSFDFQGGEPVRPLPNGKINYEEYTQAEYGPKTAIWRLLRILEEEDVKATFMVCGGIAERYPDAVRAIVSEGHEIAGHGYHHEVARDLTRDNEKDVMVKAAAMIQRQSGAAPVGWRSCTQSSNTLELLMEHGYLWNSNDFSHDLPFLWSAGERKLVELPRQPFGDGRTYGHDSGNPADSLVIWKALFDELYQESEQRASYCPFQFHPFISGRPGRARALREIVRHIKRADGVWFATCSEIAHWCLKEVFTAGRAQPTQLTAAALVP